MLLWKYCLWVCDLFFFSLNNVYQRTEVLRFDDVRFINFIFLWIMLHFEFILLDSVRLGWSGFCFVLFFYTWIFNCLSIIHLKDCHFHTKLPLHLSWKSIDHIWVYFGLYFTSLIYLSLFISTPYFLDCCSFRSLEIWYCKFSNFVIFQSCFSYSRSFDSHGF